MSKKISSKEKEDATKKVEHTEGMQQEASPTKEKIEENGAECEEVEQPVAIEVDPIDELQNQLDESKDKYIRLSAEFDNFRKRTLREKMDLMKYASEDVIKGILPLIDDFERAITHSETASDIEAMKQGLVLIHGKFLDFLKNNGVKEIEAMEQELDTDKHDAVTKTPAPKDKLKGKIVDVVQKGYMLNDKVIRFSKVVIGE
ncbi:MAG: nucleotide exchange factor GrpE [Tenuifilaceae bacterium]|nr:nucleotide exchange factor GrpE [Tenuifilaceae bacterium]